MRVQFLLPGFEVSGGVLCVLEHARGLLARGHDVTIYAPQLPSPEVQAHLPASVQALVREHVTSHAGHALPEADVQVATHHNTALTVAQSPGRLRAHFVQHAELIFSVGSPNPGLLAPFIRMVYTLPLYRITNSLWAQATLARLTGVRPDRATNAVSLAVAERPALQALIPPVTVVSFTHPAVWKGAQDALDAMVLARAMAPEMELQWHVFGGGAAGIPDTPWIHKAGMVAHADLPTLYQRAAALLFTSWAESYPLPPIEAMAAGCPVITTPFGVEDYVTPDGNAIVIPPRDPLAAATALVTLLREPVARRQALVDAGQATAQVHTWERATAALEQAFRRGLAMPAAPDPTAGILEELGLPVIGA